VTQRRATNIPMTELIANAVIAPARTSHGGDHYVATASDGKLRRMTPTLMKKRAT
jgi:hypothetical protein